MIKEIKCKNFQGFSGKIILKKYNFIFAPNGDGKTLAHNAILWCYQGSVNDKVGLAVGNQTMFTNSYSSFMSVEIIFNNGRKFKRVLKKTKTGATLSMFVDGNDKKLESKKEAPEIINELFGKDFVTIKISEFLKYSTAKKIQYLAGKLPNIEKKLPNYILILIELVSVLESEKLVKVQLEKFDVNSINDLDEKNYNKFADMLYGQLDGDYTDEFNVDELKENTLEILKEKFRLLINDKQADVTKTRNTVEKLNKKALELNKGKELINILNSDLEELNLKRDKLLKQIESNEKDVENKSKLETEQSTLSTEIEELNSIVLKYPDKETLEKLNANLQSINKKIYDKNNKIQILILKLESVKTKEKNVSDITEEYNTINQKLDKVDIDLSKYPINEELKILKEKNLKLNKKLQEELDESDTLHNSFVENSNFINNLKTEILKEKNQIKELQKNLDFLYNILPVKLKDILNKIEIYFLEQKETKVRHIKNYNKKLVELKEKQDSILKKQESILKEIETLKSKITKIKLPDEAELATLLERQKNLTITSINLDTKLEMANKKLGDDNSKTIQKNIDKITEKVKTLEIDKEKIENQIPDTKIMTENKTKRTGKQEELKKLNEKIESIKIEKSIDNLNHNLKSVNESISEKQKQIKSKNEAITANKIALEELPKIEDLIKKVSVNKTIKTAIQKVQTTQLNAIKKPFENKMNNCLQIINPKYKFYLNLINNDKEVFEMGIKKPNKWNNKINKCPFQTISAGEFVCFMLSYFDSINSFNPAKIYMIVVEGDVIDDEVNMSGVFKFLLQSKADLVIFNTCKKTVKPDEFIETKYIESKDDLEAI